MSKLVPDGIRCKTCRKRRGIEHFLARPDHVPADRAALAERLAGGLDGLDAAPARTVRPARPAPRPGPRSQVVRRRGSAAAERLDARDHADLAGEGDPFAEVEAEDEDTGRDGEGLGALAGAGSRWWHGWGWQGVALVAGLALLLVALVFAARQGNANAQAAAAGA